MERNTFPTKTMIGPHPELTPDYTPQGLTPAPSQSNLALLQEATLPPSPVADPSNQLCVHALENMPIIPRFLHLLRQSKALIEAHGPHTTFTGTTVFSRAPLARNRTKDVSTKDFALCLAAAQDSAGSAQIDGPSKEDLTVFRYLWDTTVEVLELTIGTGDLDHETATASPVASERPWMASSTAHRAAESCARETVSLPARMNGRCSQHSGQRCPSQIGY
jgi:hypothetical protein